MALTVVTTPGDPTANSYASVADADTYHESRPSNISAAWLAATPEDKSAAVVMATELLDANFQWTGAPTTPDVQVLGWPRTGMLSRLGTPIATNVIPGELKRATSEFARQLITTTRTADNDVKRQGITDLKVASIGVSFSEDAPTSGTPQVLPDAVINLIPSSWYVPFPKTADGDGDGTSTNVMVEVT